MLFHSSDKEGSILKWDDRGGAKVLPMPMVTVQYETELPTVQDEYSGFEVAKNGHQLTEKAVETEKVSDYLRFSSKRSADFSELDSNKAKEILEMYETAEYYGVFKNASEFNWNFKAHLLSVRSFGNLTRCFQFNPFDILACSQSLNILFFFLLFL